MALGAVGGDAATFERTIGYAKEREAFGRPIGKLPGDPPQARRDGDEVEAPRDSPTTRLRLFLDGRDAHQGGLDGQAVRLPGGRPVADEAVQIHGGYGYMREYDVERALRDARLGPIGGGTDEIMKEITTPAPTRRRDV